MSDPPLDGILSDLRHCAAVLERIAARLEATGGVSPPFWSCGHRHASRDEATLCLRNLPARLIPREWLVR